jgi:hypothetical protein
VMVCRKWAHIERVVRFRATSLLLTPPAHLPSLQHPLHTDRALLDHSIWHIAIRSVRLLTSPSQDGKDVRPVGVCLAVRRQREFPVLRLCSTLSSLPFARSAHSTPRGGPPVSVRWLAHGIVCCGRLAQMEAGSSQLPLDCPGKWLRCRHGFPTWLPAGSGRKKKLFHPGDAQEMGGIRSDSRIQSFGGFS